MRIVPTSIVSVVLITGCGFGVGFRGGTEGELIVGDSWRLPEIEIGFHLIKGESQEHVGMGVTDPQGYFRVSRANGSGPLQLAPGSYRITIESVGADYQEWSEEYRDPEKTPLVLDWGSTSGIIQLRVPEPIKEGDEVT